MSFFYGYKKDDIETIGGLPTTGGEMTGDINMGNNKIITSADPTENSHLARKKYVDEKVSNVSASGNFLTKTGGVMTGNIIMGNNNILSNLDPTNEKHLARKKYVDDQDSKKLSLTGGTMLGNIDIGNHKILTISDPVGEKHLARKKYVDTQDAKKLSLTGGTMTGNINIGNHKIISCLNPTNDNHLTRKKYIDEEIVKFKKDVSFSILKDNFSLKFHNLFFVEYDSAYDLLFERNGGKVKELRDFGIEGNKLEQSTKSLQLSLCLESEKEDNKYFLKFNNNRMNSDSNINPITGKQDIINVFIVYKLNSVPSSGSDWLKGGLFGNDNGGYDKFIAFANPTTRDLVVSGDSKEFIVIGGNNANHRSPLAAFQTKANAGDLNKWICLSVHWDSDISTTNQSSVWCNGKKLCNFTARSVTGNVKLTLGDIKNSNNSPLDGSIIFFSVLKYKKMIAKEILFYHYILCNLYNVDHDTINI